MMENDLDLMIEAIFESSHFRMLLQQQIQQSTNPRVSVSVPTQLQGVMEEISDSINQLVKFKIQQCFNEQYSGLVKGTLNFRQEIDQLKQEIHRIQLNGHSKHCQPSRQGKEGHYIHSEKILGNSQISDQTKATLKQQNLQLTRIRQDIDSLKLSVNKLSSNSLLQFVSEANLQMQQRMEENFARISSDIQEMSTRNSQPDLDKSTHSVLNCQYDSELMDKVTDINQKLNKFKADLEQKIENNFRSVWNVITNMQNNIASTKRQSPDSMEQFESPTHKTVRKGGSIASILGWKS